MWNAMLSRARDLSWLVAIIATVAVLCGMTPNRGDTIVAREITLVDAQGRPRIYLRVNDQGTAGVSLYHPNGEALVSILADESAASISLGTADGKPHVKLHTSADGTPTLELLDREGRNITPGSREPSASKKAADAARVQNSAERGPLWTRLAPAVYRDEDGKLAIRAPGVCLDPEVQRAASSAHVDAKSASSAHADAKSRIEQVLVPHMTRMLASLMEGAQGNDVLPMNALDPANIAPAMAQEVARWGQQLDSWLDERDDTLWILLCMPLNEQFSAAYEKSARIAVDAALARHSIEPPQDLAAAVSRAVRDSMAAIENSATALPESSSGKARFVKPGKDK